MKTEVEFKIGDIVKFKVLEWSHEGWEFGSPVVMLSPVIRSSHDAGSADTMIEEEIINIVAVDNGSSEYNNAEDELEFRGWRLKYLNKCFNEAMKGKKFPKAHYEATEYTAEVVKNRMEDFDIDFKIIKKIKNGKKYD